MFEFTVVRLEGQRRPSSRKLTPEDQKHIALMDALRLWSRAAIAKAYGVDRARVAKIVARHLIVTT